MLGLPWEFWVLYAYVAIVTAHALIALAIRASMPVSYALWQARAGQLRCRCTCGRLSLRTVLWPPEGEHGRDHDGRTCCPSN